MAARTAAQAMARQQWKKRIAKQTAERKRHKDGIHLSWQMIQFLACGSAFVLLVTLKLLSNDHAQPLRAALGTAMRRNMDVQAVFSTVGSLFTGEDAQGLYQAVFQPGEFTPSDGETGAETPETPYHWRGTLQDGAALEMLWSYQAIALDTPESGASLPEDAAARDDAAQAESTDSGETASGNSGVLYGGQTLPEGVKMEQVILNFAYTAPLDGTLTSSFGYREHPIEGGTRFHYGVDLAAAEGTDIVCFADGLVAAVGESSSYGKYCMVAHSGGNVSIYAHCSRISVSSGQEVHLGEKIAEVGQTGQATGPHLHFELQSNGIYLNPIYYVVS